MLTFLQEKFIFLPTQLPQDYVYTFEGDFEEFFLTHPDGAKLNALQFKSKNPKGAILYFHGNAGDLSRWGEIAIRFVDFNYDVIVMDYRGYGKSTGERSETKLLEDAQLFYEYTGKIFPSEKIVVYGRSLGASIATFVASKNKVGKLILETPFYNLTDVAEERFPLLPMKTILKYKLASNKYIQQVQAPIRIFHGTEDRVVAYNSGKRLFQVIPIDNKKMYTVDGGKHNDLDEFEEYWNAIREELTH
ncbi:alpha/beta hydrolase [Flagellimonas sp.]|uniref:alpha/beta hydrolase n=1 Tax=Flagellimonas sp. TaxID=2058762 RepID=UPI003F4A16FC